MKPGHSSKTAEMVCEWRAIADGKAGFARFSDPTALALLPADAQARVRQVLSGPPARRRDRIARASIEARAQMMVARTVAIDDALREHPTPQVVILGAGLDGRAFRMPELADSTVFEVDHPDSQREKRTRSATLTPVTRALHFVPVDFASESLDDALTEAGHDPGQPTFWVWEGVIMYLTPQQVDATLRIVARRSAPRSRLVGLYHSPALMVLVIGLLVRRIGEPFRSTFKPEAMAALLEAHGFRVLRDQGLAEIGKGLSKELAKVTRSMDHNRIVTAERA